MAQLHYEDRYFWALGLPASFWKFFYTAILVWGFFFAIDWAVNGSRFTVQQTSWRAGQHLFFMFEMFVAIVIALGIITFLDSGNKEEMNAL